MIGIGSAFLNRCSSNHLITEALYMDAPLAFFGGYLFFAALLWLFSVQGNGNKKKRLQSRAPRSAFFFGVMVSSSSTTCRSLSSYRLVGSWEARAIYRRKRVSASPPPCRNYWRFWSLNLVIQDRVTVMIGNAESMWWKSFPTNRLVSTSDKAKCRSLTV